MISDLTHKDSVILKRELIFDTKFFKKSEKEDALVSY